MSFVSYAQNFEDVMLWRALKHVERGFFIDLGAWSPDLDSATRAFYESGWHGVNVEPNPEFHHQLEERRPRDINLRLAVGERDGSLVMNFLGNPGLSTLVDSIANGHQKEGWSLDRQSVQVKTLAGIWQAHVPLGQAVHFLKVDIEGFEEQALRSNNWGINRPWIVLVEATLPMSQVESFEAWEPILLAADYRFAYADGLNRFYVASEHSELLAAFKYPPNVFDGFKLAAQCEAEARVVSADSRVTQAEAAVQQADARSSQAEAVAIQAEARAARAEIGVAQACERASHAEVAAHNAWMQYQAVINSRTWRISAPLRWLAEGGKWFVRGGLAWLTLKPDSRPRRTAKLGLLHLRNWVLLRPRVKAGASAILLHFPRFKDRLSRLHRAQAGRAGRSSMPGLHPVMGQPHRNLSAPVDLESCLTEEAESIFKRLAGGGL